MATPNAPSSTARKRKRKHGMVAASREASIPVLKERVQKKMKLQHKPKTVLVSGNHDKAAKLIKWLFDQEMTRGLTISTDSEFKIKNGTRYY